MATTTNYSFDLPVVGGNQDSWGGLLNGNWSALDTELKSVSDYTVPSGGIILWSGAVANIPSGWLLCDGTNGTPNLQDRFVVGAGSSYAVGATGGATTDSITTSSNGSHSHGGATGTSSVVVDHDGWEKSGSGLGSGTSGDLVVATGSSEYQEFLESITTANGDRTTGSHSHTISADGSHTHTATVDTVPPYYALAYIMKA